DVGATDTAGEVVEDTATTPDVGEDVDASMVELPPLGDGPSYDCMVEKCPAEACLDLPECAAAWDCLGDCNTIACAEACTALAPPPFQGAVQNALECGVAALCFSAGSGLDTCGNGMCDEGETLLNCTNDCSVFGDQELAFECILENCSVGNCLQGDNCSFGLKCMAPCTDISCTNACLNAVNGGGTRNFLASVVLCAVEAECMPPAAGPICGNASCEFGESKLSCPDDCGVAPPGYVCMLETCDVSFCPSFNSCNNALECLGQCEDAQCSKQCIENGPNQAAGLLLSIGQCGAQNDCMPEAAFPPNPECGNTTCDVDETIANCPADCSVSSELCGNGQCDLGESPEGCAADCDPLGGTCAAGCGLIDETAPCHCVEACEGFGSCCADYEPECAAHVCILENCDGATGCAAAQFCSVALSCISKCDSSECAQVCKEGQPEANLEFLDGYIACSDSSGCMALNTPDPDPTP
ncbi:MAG: hypothetical protein ACI9OJ_000920, partial [Myxococcota bacterium]